MPGPTNPSTEARLARTAWPTLVAGTAVVLGMAVATHSVVRYKLWIVLVYTALAALLAAWLLLSRTKTAGPAQNQSTTIAAVAVLTLTAVMHVKVRPYTYLTPTDGWLVRWIFAGSALGVAAVLVATIKKPRAADLGLAMAVGGYLTAAALLIHLDPTPKIDVWVTLQQAADGLLHGENMYSQNWTGSPGVQDAFTYLPFTGLLLAPGRWLAGDVRWALVVITLLGVLAVRLLGAKGTRGMAVAAAALLLLLPGTATQVEQAWTEPLLMACLAGWALGVQRRNTVLAVVCLALGVASKQHLIVLLPVLAAWPQFGPRKAVASGALAGVFVLPWIVASPADIWHDTVTTLVHFQPLLFADTLYIAAIKQWQWTPPFWLTGAAVLLTLAAAMVLVHRRNPDLGTVLRWAALFLFVANLVNKQAFYNQYWLVAALVVISLAVPPPMVDDVSTPDLTENQESPAPARPPAAAEA